MPSSLHRIVCQVAATAAVLATVAGCASSAPTRFYSLAVPTTATTPNAPAASAATSGAPAFVALGPVAVPERLARQQMVVLQDASGSGAVRILDESRWSASLQDELRDALAAGVAAQLGAVDVSRAAAPANAALWRVSVQVRQFDLAEGGSVAVALSWSAQRAGGEASAADADAQVVVCQWSRNAQGAAGAAALADTARGVVAQASGAIASSVAALRSGRRECPAAG